MKKNLHYDRRLEAAKLLVKRIKLAAKDLNNCSRSYDIMKDPTKWGIWENNIGAFNLLVDSINNADGSLTENKLKEWIDEVGEIILSTEKIMFDKPLALMSG